MPDSHGYPTEAELKAIDDFEGTSLQFVDHVQSIWWHTAYDVSWDFDSLNHPIRRWKISTVGWSGNEEIISRMQTTMFWFMWWHQSSRGGHYEFQVPVKFWNRVMHLGRPKRTEVEDDHA